MGYRRNQFYDYEKIVDDLGLSPTGIKIVSNVETTVSVPSYDICVFLPNKVFIHDLEVALGKMSGCDILIGMDIISQGDFAITYKGEDTILSFRTPPLKEIDFVQEINRSNVAGIKRNAPCPCGSGKKFKKCCGKNLL